MGRKRCSRTKAKVRNTKGRAGPERSQGEPHKEVAEAWGDGPRQLMGGVGQPGEVWLLRAHKLECLLGPSPQVPVMGGGLWRELEGPLTCTTRTRLSGYLVKTAEKASTGSRSTVESRAARADTVRWGCW